MHVRLACCSHIADIENHMHFQHIASEQRNQNVEQDIPPDDLTCTFQVCSLLHIWVLNLFYHHHKDMLQKTIQHKLVHQLRTQLQATRASKKNLLKGKVHGALLPKPLPCQEPGLPEERGNSFLYALSPGE